MTSEWRSILGADPGFQIEWGLVASNRLHYLLWLDGVIVDGSPSLGRLYRAATKGGRAKYREHLDRVMPDNGVLRKPHAGKVSQPSKPVADTPRIE
jgi:hypothetical protein